MTKSETIIKFTLYLDDMSELSTAEAEDLYDKIYSKISASRPWEGTKTAHTGTQSTSLSYISLPTDFLYLTANNNTTDGDLAGNPVIFVGSTYTPYKVVSWSDRRQYRDNANVAWVDIPNSRLYFAKQPTAADAVEYDYHRIMPELLTSESAWFPSSYHDIIYHGMCVDDFIIQQSDKAKSYQKEHEKQYQSYMEMLAYWNAGLIQM